MFINKTENSKKIGGYDEKFMCQDGYYIWMKLLKYQVENINKPLFYYRKHGSNLTSNTSFINRTKSRILEYINKKIKKTFNCNTAVQGF